VLSFSFTTESTVDTLELISATATAQTISVHPTGLTTAAIPGLGLPGHADLYVGVLNVPYYSSKAAPLTEYWHAPPFPLDTTSTFVTRFNPLPVPTATLQIPVLVSVPNAASALGAVSPAAGWPVLVFQHGITRNREDLFGVADSLPTVAWWWWRSTCRCTASPTRRTPCTPAAPIRCTRAWG